MLLMYNNRRWWHQPRGTLLKDSHTNPIDGVILIRVAHFCHTGEMKDKVNSLDSLA